MRVRFTPSAQSDIDGIFQAIAEHDPSAAQRVENGLRWTAEGLARFPAIGAPTDIEHVRRLPVVRYPYTIFYRVNAAEAAVEILRIVHGARVRDRGRVPE